MIVDFTVSNFRSIKEVQTLSFYAQRKTEHLAENIHYPAEAKIGVLTSAGIYGANASGKSNFLLALKALSEFVSESGDLKDGEPIDAYEPYRLSQQTKDAPTSFELEFVLNGERYLYKVSFDAKRIYSEYLGFYPKGKTRSVIAKLFERNDADTWKDISFGSLLTGGTKRYPLFANNAYLSKAGNSADSPKKIRDVYQYLCNSLVFKDVRRLRADPQWKNNGELIKTISAFLSIVDVGICGMVIRKEDNSDVLDNLPTDLPEPIKAKILEDVNNLPFFEHVNESGDSEFFEESIESTGTQYLVHILPLLVNVLEKGKILIWDEIESSLHPHIVELVVKLFNDPCVNVSHAQLLFTTHNMALMNQHTMRKDQLWLTEKHQGSTSISSLEDFNEDSLKPSSPFAKWYDEGRLGGIPTVHYGAVRELMTPKVEDNKDAEA
jgi:AAA15 family ATPase/GTPase